MKAIILAAGMGTRISKFINEKPKCLVDIGGTTLIEYTVSLLKGKGIKNITIVIGYKANDIKEVLKDKDVNIVYNPFFDVTNGIASMWFARDYLDEEETIVMSGDLYVVPEIIDDILTAEKDPVLLVDSSRIIEADFRFNYGGDNVLKKFGKDLSIAETTAENLGIAKLGKDYVVKYKNHLLEMINNQKHSVWWENVFYDRVNEDNIYVKDIKGKFWAEVDFIEDYRKIVNFRKENKLF